MIKKLSIILLALVLLAVPTAGRWLYYYDGRYQPTEVTRPDLAQIEAELPETKPFVDREVDATSGTVLVDLAHGNRVEMAELNILQARLSARGQQLEPVTEAGDLAGQLAQAQALVIISPGVDWAADEIQQVERFVDKGGRLLLMTDPTRFEVTYDDWDMYAGLDHDAGHLNDLAARFGFVFQADYLYNTVENEGNFRNIALTNPADHALTEGLDKVVFFAAHSIVSEGPALLAAGGETRSSTSDTAGDLTVGLLAADGAVLALGDLTFMTEPYNAVYDNDRFIANIADFVSQAQRQYDLTDFPYYFDNQTDLVYAGSPVLNGNLVKGGSNLQALFDKEGKTLQIRAAEDDTQDTLFLGLYEQAEDVEPYLEAAQVTLIFTPTETLTTTQSPTTTLESESEPAAGTNLIAIDPLGEMRMAGTSLLLRQTEGDRDVMVVLVHTEAGLENALSRLTGGDLAGCLLHTAEMTSTSQLALCPTGEEVPEGEELAADQAPPEGKESPDEESSLPPEPEPDTSPSELLGSILVVVLDEGDARYDGMTSADDYAAILEEGYEMAFWSTTQEGMPDLEALLDFDLVILTSGDYEARLNEAYSDLLFSLLLEGIPVIMSGAYSGDSEIEAVQRDIRVDDATHPLAEGFAADEVIEFVRGPSGQDYEIGVLEDFQDGEGAVAFVRGPGSEESGVATIVTMDDEFSEFQLVYIGFPLYLLPEGPKEQLVLNAVFWLLGPQG